MCMGGGGGGGGGLVLLTKVVALGTHEGHIPKG